MPKPSHPTTKGLEAYQRLGPALSPSPGAAAPQPALILSRLCRLSRTLTTLATERCNGDARHSYPDQTAWRLDLERKEERAIRNAQALLTSLPLPRGTKLAVTGLVGGSGLGLILPPEYANLHDSFCRSYFRL